MSSERPVLHIVPSAPWGGIQALVPMLAREQVAHGRTVEIVSLGRATRLADLAAEYGLAARGIAGIFAPLRLLTLLLNRRGAIVHGHCEPVWASVIIALAAARRWVDHAHVYPDGPADWKIRIAHALRRRFARRHIAISHSVGRAMLASAIATEATLNVVHNGVAVKAGAAATRMTGSWTVGFVGRVVEEKGIFDFIELVALLAPDTDFAFAVYGDGVELAAARLLAGTRGLGDRIVFHGYVEDIASAWARIDVAVILSHREPFGLVFLEAALRGVPSISYANDSGGSEVAAMLDSAYRVTPGDLAAGAAAVRTLAGDAAMSAGPLARDRVTIAERFGIAAMARGVAAAYDRLGDAAGPKP